MISQSPPWDVPAVVPPSPANRRGHPGPEGVTIGSLALPAQDTTILRALVRWLDGALGMGLRYSEDVAGCHVVFASPAALSTCPGRTTVVVTDAATVPFGWGGPITVSSPLRMSGVITALQQAMPRRRSSNPLHRQRWLSFLFERLRAALRTCGHSVLPIGGGQLLRLDAVSQSMQASVPVEQLLSHAHDLGALRPCTAADEDVLQGAETHSLSAFLWRLSATMVEARAPIRLCAVPGACGAGLRPWGSWRRAIRTWRPCCGAGHTPPWNWPSVRVCRCRWCAPLCSRGTRWALANWKRPPVPWGRSATPRCRRGSSPCARSGACGDPRHDTCRIQGCHHRAQGCWQGHRQPIHG